MIQDVINSMIACFGHDVRRINHAIKVYGFANTISRSENLESVVIDIVEIAAVLHDIGIPEAEKKYDSSAGKYQEIEGPPIASEILSKLNINPETIERVCYLIGNHHTYSKIDFIDFQILVEADFLVNIFEDNMPQSMIESIRQKYFKTRTGLRLLDEMYLS